jgi:hypothetical protein
VRVTVGYSANRCLVCLGDLYSGKIILTFQKNLQSQSPAYSMRIVYVYNSAVLNYAYLKYPSDERV